MTNINRPRKLVKIFNAFINFEGGELEVFGIYKNLFFLGFIFYRLFNYQTVFLIVQEAPSHPQLNIPIQDLIYPSFYQPHIGRDASGGM